MVRVRSAHLIVFVIISLHTTVAWAQNNFAEVDRLIEQSRQYKNSDISKSLELAVSGLEKSRALGYKEGAAQSLFHLSTLYIILQENQKAEEYLAQADKEFTKLDDSLMLMKCVFNSALINKNLRQFDISIGLYKKLLTYPEINKAPEVKVGAYNNLGNIFRETGDLDSAYLYYAKALRENEIRKDSEGIQNSLLAISAIYHDLKEYHTSISYTKAFLMSRKGVNDIRTATALHNIGITYYNLNEFDSSLSNLHRSFSIFEKIGDVSSMTDVRFAIGNCLFETGRHKEAEKYYSQALKESGKTGNSFHKAYSYYILSNLEYRDRGNVKQAGVYADSCLKILKDIDHKVLLADVSLLMSDICSATGDYKRAAEFLNTTVRLRDTIYNESKRDLIIQLDKKYDTERKNATISELTRQNEIKKLKIERKNMQIFAVTAMAVLLLAIGLMLYQIYATRNKHKRLALEQQLLLAQLNPHFIFNALSGIQHFIVTNKSKDAVFYLSSFGKLMRSVLERSRGEFTTVSEEAHLLENYLRLQQLMYEFKFNYEINIDPDNEDTNATIIPCMLIQPFVENAVKYAFAEKKDLNYIRVSFQKDSSNLKITIEDNGVGIGHGVTPGGSTSLGNVITNNRISNFNMLKGYRINLQVVNKRDQNEIESGTRIIITMPLPSNVNKNELSKKVQGLFNR